MECPIRRHASLGPPSKGLYLPGSRASASNLGKKRSIPPLFRVFQWTSQRTHQITPRFELEERGFDDGIELKERGIEESVELDARKVKNLFEGRKDDKKWMIAEITVTLLMVSSMLA